LESTHFKILVLLRRDQEMKYKAIPILIFLLFSLTLLSSVHAQPQIGEKTPGFITSTLDGKRIALKDYREQHGKRVLVLSFFATWCQPCKEDLRYLQKIQDQHGGKGLQVVAILTQDTSKEDRVRIFMGELGVTLSVLLDEYGIIGKRYAVTALPCNFVVDKDGILKAKYFGYGEDVKRHFEGQLKNLLSNP
jgi:peroxiredoxin